MTGLLTMHSNLMSAPGFGPGLNQAVFTSKLQALKCGFCRFALFVYNNDALTFTGLPSTQRFINRLPRRSTRLARIS